MLQAPRALRAWRARRPLAAAAAAQPTHRPRRRLATRPLDEPAAVSAFLAARRARGLPAKYDPAEIERGWYEHWEHIGAFRPTLRPWHDKGDTFSMVLPPPNVTGHLHLGHALTCALEDALVRWNRMRGRETAWTPGCDHAGIATQVVVEKELAKEGVSRHTLGRDAFVERVWGWRAAKGTRIYEQLRRLGASLHWEAEVFTMDPAYSGAVTEAFVRLFDRGLVHREQRIVNWSCALQSVIADIEVEQVETAGRVELHVPGHDRAVPFGLLTHFAYPLQDGGEIVVATTRLETMLGDVAVAVHPDDTRYQHLIGVSILHPLTGRQLEVVADEMVDPAFGTGAVKLTPLHDENDFECAKRLGLPRGEAVIDTNGQMINAGQFEGMHRHAAREALAGWLRDAGLHRGDEDYATNVPLCSRTGDVIEPMCLPQWFVDCRAMADKAVAASDSGGLRLHPRAHVATWSSWLSNIRPWCVSRQLWWGHRIPAYEVTAPAPAPGAERPWVCGRTEDEARAKAAAQLGVAPDEVALQQDTDVLDTWFSSGLYPIASKGWPVQDMAGIRSFPLDVLETGHDILFFWVARMVMLCTELTGQLPFKDVYLHPIIRDHQGRKMSKSLGNVIDPIHVIDGVSLEELQDGLRSSNLQPDELQAGLRMQAETMPDGIAACGSDALRFALCSVATGGQDLKLHVGAILDKRAFCNKLLNLGKFAARQFEPGFEPYPEAMLQRQPAELLVNRWLLSRLSATADEVNRCLETYQFSGACDALYAFWYDDLASWYCEAIKAPVYQQNPAARKEVQQTLYHALDHGLRMLSVFMPYLADELWVNLPLGQQSRPESVCISQFPVDLGLRSEEAEHQMTILVELTSEIRRLRSQLSLKPSDAVSVYVVAGEQLQGALEDREAQFIASLTRADWRLCPATNDVPAGCVEGVLPGCRLFAAAVQAAEDPAARLARLRKRDKQITKALAKLEGRMRSPAYATKAPPAVQAADRQTIHELQQELRLIQPQLVAQDATYEPGPHQ